MKLSNLPPLHYFLLNQNISQLDYFWLQKTNSIKKIDKIVVEPINFFVSDELQRVLDLRIFLKTNFFKNVFTKNYL
jgi:hypothetical protein